MANRRTLDRPRGRGLASTLAEAGLHVYTFDLRGHGQSSTAGNSHWNYDEIVRGDIPAVVDWVRARHPALRLGLLGHSLTGHASLFWLGLTPRAPVDALVLYATNLWLPQFEPTNWVWFRRRAVLFIWELLCKPLGYFPARRLRVGSEDVPLSFVADLRRWARTGSCICATDGVDYLSLRDNVRQPVLAITGEKDRFLCPLEYCQQFLAPVPDHRIYCAPNANHMTVVTRELSRPAWEHTAQWLVEQLDRPLSRQMEESVTSKNQQWRRDKKKTADDFQTQ
ncbi:alpha/beta fold hydrolase [Microbulbifer taiwanensis]